MNWDLVKYFVAIADSGSLVQAARIADISQPTLSRNLKQLEEEVGGDLFMRLPNELQLTKLGEQVLEAAQSMKLASEVFYERARVASGQYKERLRISATYSVSAFLSEHVGALAEAAGIDEQEVEIEPTRAVLNPAFKKADIMIRLRRLPEFAPAKVRKIGSLGFAMYSHVSTELPDSVIGMTSTRPQPQLGWVDNYARINYLPVRYRLAEFFMRRAALTRCRAVALLPCFIADRDTELRRVTEPIADLEDEAYLMVQQDTKVQDNVHKFADAIADLFHRNANLLRGECHTVQPPA